MGIINGLEALEKKVEEHYKLKKAIQSLAKFWDSQVLAIMKTNDFNTLNYNALIGFLTNYDIILKFRGRIPKEEKALKAKSYIQCKEEGEEEGIRGGK